MRNIILFSLLALFAGSARADVFAVNQKLGRDINLGNALEAPKEGAWGVTLQAEYFKVIKAAGFATVGLPARWSSHAQKSAPFAIDEDFFHRVDWEFCSGFGAYDAKTQQWRLKLKSALLD
ncbi:MAG: hypothetical protein L0Y72_10555 [Gemmataceae bacterium]|nr:hypothetical protein [Gemmataceae bacterium]MCI0739474.1 hypothetical protein [Gemmataceae bacterium]